MPRPLLGVARQGSECLLPPGCTLFESSFIQVVRLEFSDDVPSLELLAKVWIARFYQVVRLALCPRPCRARFLLELVTTATGSWNSATTLLVALLAA